MVLKADKSNEAPEVEALLAKLGNTLGAIPYFGLFQPGEDPIHFDGVYYSSQTFLEQLGAEQLAEAWGKSKELQDNLEDTTQPQRVVRLPEAASTPN